MKQLFFLVVLLISNLVFSEEIIIETDYLNSKYDVYDNKKLMQSFPFSKFLGYQIIGNKVYMIDVSNSRIFEFGRVCYYDVKENELVYTSILSGSSFYVSDTFNYIIISSLYCSTENSDIGDMFGVNESSKKYPLNIDVIDLKTGICLKKIKFDDLYKTTKLKDIFLEINEVDNNSVQISYGILDTNKRVFKGILNLQELKLSIDK